MEAIHGRIAFYDKEKALKERYYKTFIAKERTPRLTKPVRYVDGLTKWVMIRNMIIKWATGNGRYLLSKELGVLPTDFITSVYEYGLEIVTLAGTEAEAERIVYYDRTLNFRLQPFEAIKFAGIYYPPARLMVINEAVLKQSQYKIPFYYIAKCFESQVFASPDIRKVPEYHLSYDNRYAPYLIIRYADRKSKDFFAASFERFFHPERRKDLFQSDRVMHDLLKDWIDSMFNETPLTIKDLPGYQEQFLVYLR